MKLSSEDEEARAEIWGIGVNPAPEGELPSEGKSSHTRDRWTYRGAGDDGVGGEKSRSRQWKRVGGWGRKGDIY